MSTIDLTNKKAISLRAKVVFLPMSQLRHAITFLLIGIFKIGHRHLISTTLIYKNTYKNSVFSKKSIFGNFSKKNLFDG